MHELKEWNKWEETNTLIGIIMFAIDVDWYDLGKFQFTLYAMEDYFLHISPMM